MVLGLKYISQIAGVFPKLGSPHEARVGSLGRQNISGVPFNIKAEVVTFILYKSGICVFGQKYMSQMTRVFSKLASPHEARVASLGRQTMNEAPFIIKARSCHNYPALKWNL